MEPNTVQLILYAMVAAFLVALLFIPTFASAIAAVLQRHANAVSAAYAAYRVEWNGAKDAREGL